MVEIIAISPPGTCAKRPHVAQLPSEAERYQRGTGAEQMIVGETDGLTRAGSRSGHSRYQRKTNVVN